MTRPGGWLSESIIVEVVDLLISPVLIGAVATWVGAPMAVGFIRGWMLLYGVGWLW